MKQNFSKIASEVLKNLPGAREYAMDEQSKDELAAMIAAWASDQSPGWSVAGIARFLANHLQPSVSELFQTRPKVTEPLTQWLDPVTGLPAANPYAKNSTDIESQKILSVVAPELAAHLKLIANGGITYAALHKMNVEREQKKAVAEMKYGADEHSVNPYVTGDRLMQSRVREANPFMADFLQREAKPITLNPFGPTQNLTKQGAIEQAYPAHADLLRRAAAIHGDWLRQELATVSTDMTRAIEAKNRAESRLKGRRL